MKKTISILLGIILLVSQITLISVLNVEKFISPKSLSEVTNKVDIKEALITENENSINPIVSDQMIDQVDSSLLGKIYDVAARGNVSKDHVNSVINSDAVKDFSASYVEKITNYVTTGKEEKVTGEEITAFVKNNIDDVANDTGIKLDESSKNAIITVANNYSEDIALLIPSPKETLKNTDPNMITSIQKIFSSKTKTVLLMSMVISSILLLLIQLKKYRWMRWLSLITMLSGAVLCLLGYLLIPMLNVLLENQTQFILNLLQTFASELKIIFMIRGGIIIGISLVVLLVYEAISRKLIDEELDDMADDIKEEFKNSQIVQ